MSTFVQVKIGIRTKWRQVNSILIRVFNSSPRFIVVQTTRDKIGDHSNRVSHRLSHTLTLYDVGQMFLNLWLEIYEQIKNIARIWPRAIYDDNPVFLVSVAVGFIFLSLADDQKTRK